MSCFRGAAACCCLCALLLALPAEARKKRGEDPVLGRRIAEATFFQGRLWLRGSMTTPDDSTGGLVALNLATSKRQAYFERGVVDLERTAEALWVLRQPILADHRFTVSRLEPSGFKDVASFTTSRDDFPILLLSRPAGLIVLGPQAIRTYSVDAGQWASVPLKGKLRSGVQVVAAMVGSTDLYVGYNLGEFGGGVQRINVATGDITNVEHRTPVLCGGILNSDCDPVTGLIADPGDPECVLASVGLVHFGSEGRIVSICGDQITTVAKELVPEEGGGHMSEAYFGLVAVPGRGFWAITWRALYRFDGTSEKTHTYQLPKLKNMAGIHLSQEIPGAVIVLTDVNWAVSVSGYTPLVVPLEH